MPCVCQDGGPYPHKSAHAGWEVLCQVQGTQPVPIRYQIRDVSRGRRTRVTSTAPLLAPSPRAGPSSVRCQASRTSVAHHLSVLADARWMLAEESDFRLAESKRHTDTWQRWRGCIVVQIRAYSNQICATIRLLPSALLSTAGEDVAVLLISLWIFCINSAIMLLYVNIHVNKVKLFNLSPITGPIYLFWMDKAHSTKM